MIFYKGLVVGLLGLTLMARLSPGFAETGKASQLPSGKAVKGPQFISPDCGGNPPTPYPTSCGSHGVKQVCNGVGDCCAITNTTCLGKGGH
jgi:hypothetical protein